MKNILTLLISGLLIFSGFVNYGMEPFFNLPVLISVLLFIMATIDIALGKRYTFSVMDIVFIVTFVTLGLANYVFRNQEFININHLFAICFCYIVFYWLPFQVFVRLNIDLMKILKWITMGLVLSLGIGIVEVVWQNITGTSTSLIPSLTMLDNNGGTFTLFGQTFYRCRGVAEEPTHFMLYVGTFLPIVIFNFKRKNNTVRVKLQKLGMAFLVILTIFYAFSTSWLVSMVLTTFVYILYDLIKRRGNISSSFAKLAGIFVALYAIGFKYINEIVSTMLYKLSGAYNSGEGMRINRWQIVLSNYLNSGSYIIGMGPGYISESALLGYKEGVVNLYIKLLVEWGFIGLAMFLGFIFYHANMANKIKYDIQKWFVFSIIYVTIFYFSSDNFYFPFLWLLFAIVKYTYYRCNAQDHSFRVD